MYFNSMSKVLYIAGDGRSGSTLLEGVLTNVKDSISVGECNRFWSRYYTSNYSILCGCGELMQKCPHWSAVDGVLSNEIENYDPERVLDGAKKFTNFSSAKNLSDHDQNPDYRYLQSVVGKFYAANHAVSGAGTVVDSSKSPGWGLLLLHNDTVDPKYIHLERDLASVASSWKKELVLPQHIGKEVYMPIRSDANILRTWLRVKALCQLLPDTITLRFKYLDLEQRLFAYLDAVRDLAQVEISQPLVWNDNHAIAGNPARRNSGEPIRVKPTIQSTSNLSRLQKTYFQIVDRLANRIMK